MKTDRHGPNPRCQGQSPTPVRAVPEVGRPAPAAGFNRVNNALEPACADPNRLLSTQRLTDTVPAMTDTSQKPEIAVPAGDPPADLVIEDLAVGDGPEAVAGVQVNVDYVGVSWSTGAEFDASWNRGDVFAFALGGGMVIPGWDQGVAGMKVGGRRQLTIPPGMAYGAAGAGGVIGPNETLIFVVDLRSIG